MSLFLNWNGNVVKEQEAVISPDNRSFKYGDGCFETMKVKNGKLLLAPFHFGRLLSSLKTLQFTISQHITTDYLMERILQIVSLNRHTPLARVRLTAFRGSGNLYNFDNNLHFIIQSLPGNESSEHYNQTGLVAGFYYDSIKAADRFSGIKSNNYLPYAMGAIWAKHQKLDDCFLFNNHNRLAEATIANVFIVSEGVVKTPALTEGCVDGVMRRYLIEAFQNNSVSFKEGGIDKDEILQASEVFLTNAIYGIRWVQTIEDVTYSNERSSAFHQNFIVPLFS